MPKIIVNGKEENTKSSTLSEYVITEKKLKAEHVVAEYNGNIIKKENWDKILLKDFDHIEIVNFVGGG